MAGVTHPVSAPLIFFTKQFRFLSSLLGRENKALKSDQMILIFIKV